MPPIDPRRIEVMDDRVAEIMRRLTPAEKIAKVDELWELGRAVIEGSVRQQHPQWSEEEVRQEVVRRMSRGDGH